MWKSQPLVPVNKTLCENRVFADDRVRKVTVGEPWSSVKGPLMTGDAWTRTRTQGRGRGGVTGPGLGLPAPGTVSPAVSAVKLALRGAWSQHPGRTDAELCPLVPFSSISGSPPRLWQNRGSPVHSSHGGHSTGSGQGQVGKEVRVSCGRTLSNRLRPASLLTCFEGTGSWAGTEPGRFRL